MASLIAGNVAPVSILSVPYDTLLAKASDLNTVGDNVLYLANGIGQGLPWVDQ